MIHVYSTPFNDVILPEEPPTVMKESGWPDRRYAIGRIYQEYLNYVTSLAEFAWRGNGRLKIAPPFSAWRKHYATERK